jgi:hypothetical protein
MFSRADTAVHSMLSQQSNEETERRRKGARCRHGQQKARVARRAEGCAEAPAGFIVNWGSLGHWCDDKSNVWNKVPSKSAPGSIADRRIKAATRSVGVTGHAEPQCRRRVTKESARSRRAFFFQLRPDLFTISGGNSSLTRHSLHFLWHPKTSVARRGRSAKPGGLARHRRRRDIDRRTPSGLGTAVELRLSIAPALTPKRANRRDAIGTGVAGLGQGIGSHPAQGINRDRGQRHEFAKTRPAKGFGSGMGSSRQDRRDGQ